MRSIAFALSLGAVLLAGAPAGAAGPDRKACIAAADDGQKLRDDNKLNAAREKFILCASKACPGAVAKECSQWLADAERDMPSITFRAKDEHGKEILDVRVIIDGTAVAESIEARALPIDPGEHKVRFERSNGKSVEDKVVLRPAEKNKLIEMSFAPAGGEQPPAKEGGATTTVTMPPSEPGKGFQFPVLGWVGVGIAVVGAGMTAFFAVTANSDESDLRSTCAPKCSASDKESLDQKVLLANVGLGVAGLGVAVAVVATIMANSGGSGGAGKTGSTAPHVGLTATGLGGTF